MGPSPSTPPPGSRPPPGRRPWYLVVSLVTAWLLGAAALMSGGSAIAFYREDAAELQQALDRNEDPALREPIERLTQALDKARKREFPLGAAALVLGGAMVAMAARAMSGKAGARAALVQVALARAALTVVAYLLTPDVREAEFAVAPVVGYARLAETVGQGLACLLVVVALTRPGSLAFFKGEGRSLWER